MNHDQTVPATLTPQKFAEPPTAHSNWPMKLIVVLVALLVAYLVLG